MPLTLYVSSSFRRSVRKLGAEQREIVAQILEAVRIYYSCACNLEEARRVAPRFFYKQLRKPYYEAGVESNVRVIIAREKENCVALLAGNHDQIRRFLAEV